MKKVFDFIFNNRIVNIAFFSIFTLLFGVVAIQEYIGHHVVGGIFYTILTVIDALSLIAWIIDKDGEVTVTVTMTATNEKEEE